MAPKRKKKDGGGTKSSESAAAKKEDIVTNDDPLAVLLTNIQEISKDKNRCTELLQAFLDGKCSVLDGKEEHVDCYWILLTTHFLERMVQNLEKNAGNEDVAVVLSALCHALASALYSDKNKLERSAQKAGTVRSALGRAIMSITIGTTSALQNIGQGSGTTEPALIRRAVWAATTAMDMAVNHSPSRNTAPGDAWNHAEHWLSEDAAHLDIKHEEGLAAVCEAASAALNISKDEQACIGALVENDSLQSTPTGKRRRGSRKDDSPPTIAHHFQSLMKTQLSTLIDGRVSIRRWASMTFVWFCRGQESMLDFVDGVLLDKEYWNAVLDCPAVIGPKNPPPKKSSSGKRGAQKRPAEPPKVNPPVHIPGNVSAVALASRLICILSDTGASCGLKAPTGGLDTFAANMYGLSGSGKGRGRGAAEKVPSWTRPDVRNLSSVVIYKLIQSHTACLRKNCTSPDLFAWVLVNDDTDGFGSSVPNGATPLRVRFYPSVHKSLNSLCLAAASSGEGESTNVSDSSKRLLGITSAFILASGEQNQNIVDAKLYGFAVGQLAECLRSIAGDDNRGSTPRAMEVDAIEGQEDRYERINKEYSLDQPLPVPTLASVSPAKTSRKKKKSTISQVSSVSTFGGMFPELSSGSTAEQHKVTDEDLLSLMIRAIQSTSNEEPPSAAIFTQLIEIVRCCYDLNEPAWEAPTIIDAKEDGSSKHKGKKRASSTKASQGKRKRKKVSVDSSEVAGGDEDVEERTLRRAPKGIRSPRAVLASDALNALRMLVVQIPVTSSSSHSRRELRIWLCDLLTTEHICSIVNLNHLLNGALMESYLATEAQKASPGDGPASSFFSASNSGNFRPYEKILWTAHINLCLTIGRGQPTYYAKQKVEHPLLGDAKRRLSVFRAIARFSTRKTSGEGDASIPPAEWPLSLPATQHALVASNLTSEPSPNESDVEPERFIARSLMSSVRAALAKPSMLTATEWFKTSREFDDCQAVAVESDVPLSLRDSRLFVLAVTRLPRNEQTEILNEFVGTVSTAINDLQSSASNRALVEEDADVSGFLARVVTVCATLVNVVTVGSRLRDTLISEVEPLQYMIPRFVPSEKMASSKRQEDGDWYRSETSFVGLFSDWESPIVPSVNGPLQTRHLISDETLESLRVLHEAAIQLGFLSAKRDRGYLLFSAWNASGRSASWDSISDSITRSETSAVDEGTAIRRLLDIRDDICAVHREINGDEGLFPKSILTRLLTERGDGRRPGQLKCKLESMMSKAEAIIDSILEAKDSSEDADELPLVSFAVLEAVATYIAFIVSAHTRSNDKFLPRGQRQSIGELSDDESTSSVGAGDDDDRIESLIDLNEVCETFGAAPMHPDWLDKSCCLRGGITADDAANTARRAMACLQRLCSVAHATRVKSLSQGMALLHEADSEKVQRTDLALALSLYRLDTVGAQRSSDSEILLSENAERWIGAITSLCGVETWKVKMLFENAHRVNSPHVSETFCQKAVQRIVGNLRIRSNSFEDWKPTSAEYRAGGEWELLLSETLLSSCVDIEVPEELSRSQHGLDVRRIFNIAMRWLRVQEACVGHLMPVAALLRFGLSGAVGRKYHPLLMQITGVTEDEGRGSEAASKSLDFCEPLPAHLSESATIEAHDLVVKTLSVLAASIDCADLLKRPSAAVAANLLIDSKAFNDLESMEALRVTFENIDEVRRLLAELANSRSEASSGGYLLERLLCSIQNNGKLYMTDDDTDSTRLEGLFCFLGGRPLSFDTIAKSHVEHIEILSVLLKQGHSWQQVQENAIAQIIGILSSDEWDVTVKTWSVVSDIMGTLARLQHEHPTLIGQPKQVAALFQKFANVLNEKDDSFFQTLIQWIVCNPSVDPALDERTLRKISTDLCIFLVFVVGAASSNSRKLVDNFRGGSIVVDGLMRTMDQWLWHNPSVSNDIMSLLCLLGARYNTLDTIGMRLLAIMTTRKTSDDKECIEPTERFFRFLRDLEYALSSSDEKETSSSRKFASETETRRSSRLSLEGDSTGRADAGPQISARTAYSVPNACSFVLQSGFHQQHWYNCYTCGLVWDRGCCTLCALRCHGDHDVTYSRHSSFFCDCGGEPQTEGENRGPCKCLTTIDSHDAETLADGQLWPVIDPPKDGFDCTESDGPCDHREDDSLYSLVVSTASSCFGPLSRSSLDTLKKQAESQSWTKSLFEVLESSRELHQEKPGEDLCTDDETEISSTPSASERTLHSNTALVQSLASRSGKVLNLQTLSCEAMIPIRGARSGTFQLSLSNDGTTDRVKRASLLKNGIRRRAVVADSRGRMVIAEPSSLFFCAALPFVNVRYTQKSPESPYGRGQISAVGSYSTNFNIVGMDFCRSNERHLLVWGTAEASVMILGATCDKVERRIELVFDLESEEVDYLVKCLWLPGSETMVAVVCGLFVKFFDIGQAQEDKINSIVSYAFAYDALVRDAALVPTSTRENASGSQRTVSDTVKLFMLLDTGQLLELHLEFDESGQLQEQGDLYIETGDSISLPVGGVRINTGGQPASESATMRSMGDPSSLTFLPECGVLLYACHSSPVLALLVGETEGFSGSFELLPYIIKSEVLGTGSDGYSIHGPFTHFTELGCVDHDGIKYFRVTCIGKSSRTSQPKLLCIDFNETVVFIKEILWRASMAIPGVNTISSFEGLAAFSAPMLIETANVSVSLKRSDFTERAYLCAIASNGTMVMFGEDAHGRTEVILENRPEASEPSFPLTVFEKLINVSNSEKLVFAGDRIEGNTVKPKVSPDNSSYFMCPARDGCTITISLQQNDAEASRGAALTSNVCVSHAAPVLSELLQRRLVIVALRLLVGSTTTEFIPKYISVEGRYVWLQPNLKKHYDLPLTGEEIASALRNGFVSLGIGPSFDSGNNPMIDAIEVYAARREQISHWLPLTCSEMHSFESQDNAMPSSPVVQPKPPAGESRLALSVASLSHVLQVLRTSSHVSSEDLETIRGLIQATALKDGGEIRQSLSTLLNYIEPDTTQRKKFLDDGTLTGVLKSLHSSNVVLDDLLAQAEGASSRSEGQELGIQTLSRWKQLKRTIKNCLRVSTTVAGERPGNYKAVLENMAAADGLECSVAMLAYSIMNKCQKKNLNYKDFVPDLIELCLAESLLFVDRKEEPNGTFACFDVLKRILRTPDDDVVNMCCESVLAYWRQHLSRTTDALISYRCDGCSLLPITGARYTFPDDGSSPGVENDIDLCSDCYSIGRHFALQNRYDAHTPVKIRGKTVCKTAKLSCARLGEMKRMAIPASWLVANGSVTSQSTEVSKKMSATIVDLGGFTSTLFRNLVGLLSDHFKAKSQAFSMTSLLSLMDLLVNLVKLSDNDGDMLSRVKELAETIIAVLPGSIDVATYDKEEASLSALTICIQGLSRLVGVKDDLLGRRPLLDFEDCSVEDASPPKSKGKTDPRFVCGVHGVAAVRRRCSHGANKNRRFYVCGMDRSSRCSYFRWADSETERSAPAREKAHCEFEDEVGRLIWDLLNKTDGSAPSVCVQLCEFVEREIHDQASGVLVLPSQGPGDGNNVANTKGAGKVSPLLPSSYDRQAATSDYVDGVFCSREKLQNVTSRELLDEVHREEINKLNRGEATVFDTVLDLLSHVADAEGEDNMQQEELEPSGWFPLLCEVISSSESPQYRALAKRVLKRLCGGNRAIYHCVRDHFVFAFQFRKLLNDTEYPLLAALNVKEQARQCGVNWRTGGKVSFGELPAGGLIGTNKLISEDTVTVARSMRIGVTLDELTNAAKARGQNWRNFCSLRNLPCRRAKQKDATPREGLSEAEIDTTLLAAPPIATLMWIAAALSGENQVKVLHLIDVAMTITNGDDTGRRVLASAPDQSSSSCESHAPNADAGAVASGAKGSRALLRFCTPSSLPETILLHGDKGLLRDEVHAFIIEFVVAACDPELRKAGGEVSLKLCQKLQGTDFEWLFAQLTDRALSETPEQGSNCKELFRLLQALAACDVAVSPYLLLTISRKVVEAFTTQLRFISHGASGDFFAPSGNELGPCLYDFTNCAYCQRTRTSSHSPVATSSSRPSRTTGHSQASVPQGEQTESIAMLPEQIRPFTRESLESSTEVSLCTEFAMYAQLKCRLALSDIHVSIGDPRGRYVKTIAIYFSPRQVSDANVLKSEEYADVWQRCATISLPRGATSASCCISPPVIAANLKIEYLEFYERPGGSRAEDGSLLLYCPRCTRVVSNAHGVCGHCGEVAYQCRKCRYIDHLRLDAFLCVECGYCSAANFSYNLTCGAASNAVAVVDDDSYERSIKVLRVAMKLHEELRSALMDRVRPSSGKRSLSVQKYGPALKRTFLGELPRISNDKKEAVEGSPGGHPGSLAASTLSGSNESNPSSAGNRARSLLRLAQQLRNESSSDHTRVSSLLLRQSLLGSVGGISIEDIDEVDGDMLGFISSEIDGSDPLSRLVARIQERSTRSGAARGASSGGDGPARSGTVNDNAQSGSGRSNAASAKASTDECDRLYKLMREAERECYELHRRINAWKRLENDALADLGSAEAAPSSFSPSQCSSCSGPLALQLLRLFMALLESNPETVQSAVTRNLIRALFDESPPLERELFDAKRNAIVYLATKSEVASKIILDQLHLRLKGSRDAASAEILGKIIAVDSSLGEDFVKLAAEILESGY